jgi:hypothetical protein
MTPLQKAKRQIQKAKELETKIKDVLLCFSQGICPLCAKSMTGRHNRTILGVVVRTHYVCHNGKCMMPHLIVQRDKFKVTFGPWIEKI